MNYYYARTLLWIPRKHFCIICGYQENTLHNLNKVQQSAEIQVRFADKAVTFAAKFARISPLRYSSPLLWDLNSSSWVANLLNKSSKVYLYILKTQSTLRPLTWFFSNGFKKYILPRQPWSIATILVLPFRYDATCPRELLSDKSGIRSPYRSDQVEVTQGKK
jgi:hypothetical protein